MSKPDVSIGNTLTQAGLRSPISQAGDTIPARQATLLQLEQASGQPTVHYTEATFALLNDAANGNGTFESSGVFGKPLSDLLTAEGNYTFHFQASFGSTCIATREQFWSLHVDIGIDPTRTGVSTTVGGSRPDGTNDVTVVVTPRDKYGNNLGPGRSDGLTVTGAPGTTVADPIKDNGDGSYGVSGTWNPGFGQPPGVVIGQPGRPPVVVQAPPPVQNNCRQWKILFWVFFLLTLLLLFLLWLVVSEVL